MEAIQKFGPNVVGFHLTTGGRRWYIVGCHFAPNNTSTIESVVAALKERPRGAKLLVEGDFNANLSEPEGDWRGEDIVAALATEELKDRTAHFLLLQRSWCRDRRMWSMIQAGREVMSRADYILGTDRHLFWNVYAQDPRHNSDHDVVLGCLPSVPLREHSKNLGGVKRLLIRTPTTPTREDRIFAALQRDLPKPQAQDTRKNLWILEATWIIF